MILRLIGLWSDSSGTEWPQPADHVDPGWDTSERKLVGDYLTYAYMTGVGAIPPVPCTICGTLLNRGASLTDGAYAWNSDLAHYITEHSVRLPQEFTNHIHATVDAVRDPTWWKTAYTVARRDDMLRSDPTHPRVLHEIGQWADSEHPGFPSPRCQNPGWDELDKECLTEYLQTCFVTEVTSDGTGTCQLCGQLVERSHIRTDGVFAWRSDLPHYVAEHDINLPQPIIDRMNETIDAQIDWDWWKTVYATNQ
ncbi:MAG: hypothetical protein LBI99_06015 [Propionibacteriaceae bacterium]|jgi:hypothetical protein|nr:hypothetical protein [Propionibacteriaceae bacterium]